MDKREKKIFPSKTWLINSGSQFNQLQKKNRKSKNPENKIKIAKEEGKNAC